MVGSGHVTTYEGRASTLSRSELTTRLISPVSCLSPRPSYGIELVKEEHASAGTNAIEKPCESQRGLPEIAAHIASYRTTSRGTASSPASASARDVLPLPASPRAIFCCVARPRETEADRLDAVPRQLPRMPANDRWKDQVWKVRRGTIIQQRLVVASNRPSQAPPRSATRQELGQAIATT